MQYPQGQNCCDSNYQNTCYTGCGTQYPIVPGSNPALNYWNGQNFVVADGSYTSPISLPFIQTNFDNPSFVVGANSSGLWSYYPYTGSFAQVNSDWDATSGIPQILNKPSFNSGKTIYVDAGVGTDSRGSTSKYSFSVPFATIAAAVAASAINDLVYVNAGAYTITSQISLNGKGDLFFAQDANVTVAANVVAFSLTADQPKIVGGYGTFTCSGTGGLWTQSGGTSLTQLVSIEFLAITNASGAGTIFASSTGSLVINSTGVVNAPASTVISETGTSGAVFYQVLFTYCARLLDMTQANSTMQFTALCWTVQIFGTEGISIVGGRTSLRIENLVGGGNPATKLVVFKFANGDATNNGYVFRGGRLFANSANPCITFNSTTATNKLVRLMGDVELITNGANCIVSADPRQVVVSSANANVVADSNTTIVGGTLLVSPFFV
jgi:hypothetical protein